MTSRQQKIEAILCDFSERLILEYELTQKVGSKRNYSVPMPMAPICQQSDMDPMFAAITVQREESTMRNELIRARLIEIEDLISRIRPEEECLEKLQDQCKVVKDQVRGKIAQLRDEVGPSVR